MTTYVGNDNSSYQQPQGYYYNAYVENGPYAQHLKEAGQVAGEAALGSVGGTLGAPTGAGMAVGATIGAVIGHYAGGSAGEAAGFYIDNISAMVQNMNTFFNELNDPNSWMSPEL